MGQAFNVSQAYDGVIDGQSLLAFADSPDALSKDSLLLEIVPLSQLSRLVYAIQVSAAAKQRHAPDGDGWIRARPLTL